MLLINANIMSMDAPDIKNGFVRVLNGKIIAVGNMKDMQKPEQGEDIENLEGKTLLPGFIDAHCHLGLYESGLGIEGDDLNEETDPVTPHLRAIDGINPLDRCFEEARNSGVTCAVISPGSANPIAGQICAVKTGGRWIDEMVVAQPLAMKFALGENPKMVYGNKSQSPVTRMATVAVIREHLTRTQRYIEDARHAKDDPESAAPDFDAKLEALVPVLEGKIRAHFHAHKAYDILSAVRIADEYSLKYTLIHCTEGHIIADILAKLNARAVCGPLLCARTKPELTNLSDKNCAILVNAGVTVAISTDYPEIPADFLASSAAFATAAGMSRQSALESVTIAAAKAVDLDDRLGSITVGKDADLLVFSRDPLEVGAKPERVYINGEIVR